MKKLTIIVVVGLLAVGTALGASARKGASKKSKTTTTTTTVIESTDLCSARGYRSTTPVKVTIAADKVVAVEALPNQETPRFFQRVIDILLPQYKGVTVKRALEMTAEPIPDGCTGATYSARAVQQNIKAALEKHRSK